MSADNELWAYDEPHESDGNCHVTMTRRQAIEWFRSVYPLGATDDESLFGQWASLHFAYKAEPTLPVAAVRDALAKLRAGYTLRADGEGASIPWRAATDLARQELDATMTALGLGAEYDKTKGKIK